MDINKLKGHVPDAVIAQLPDTMAKFKIDTPIKLAHFLAQAGHESGGFKVVTENLNYSAEGLQREGQVSEGGGVCGREECAAVLRPLQISVHIE